MKKSSYYSIIWLLAAIAFSVLSACGEGETINSAQSISSNQGQDGNICGLPDAVPSGDHKRLALIVGVGKYANSEVNELPGASADARRIYELLTGENGYDFPAENVCLLLDERATKANVRAAF